MYTQQSARRVKVKKERDDHEVLKMTSTDKRVGANTVALVIKSLCKYKIKPQDTT